MPHCIRSVHKSDYCNSTLILSLRSLVHKHSNLGRILTRTYFLTIVHILTLFLFFNLIYIVVSTSLTMPTAFVSIVYLRLLTLFFFLYHAHFCQHFQSDYVGIRLPLQMLYMYVYFTKSQCQLT